MEIRFNKTIWISDPTENSLTIRIFFGLDDLEFHRLEYFTASDLYNTNTNEIVTVRNTENSIRYGRHCDKSIDDDVILRQVGADKGNSLCLVLHTDTIIQDGEYTTTVTLCFDHDIEIAYNLTFEKDRKRLRITKHKRIKKSYTFFTNVILTIINFFILFKWQASYTGIIYRENETLLKYTEAIVFIFGLPLTFYFFRLIETIRGYKVNKNTFTLPEIQFKASVYKPLLSPISLIVNILIMLFISIGIHHYSSLTIPHLNNEDYAYYDLEKNRYLPNEATSIYRTDAPHIVVVMKSVTTSKHPIVIATPEKDTYAWTLEKYDLNFKSYSISVNSNSVSELNLESITTEQDIQDTNYKIIAYRFLKNTTVKHVDIAIKDSNIDIKTNTLSNGRHIKQTLASIAVACSSDLYPDFPKDIYKWNTYADYLESNNNIFSKYMDKCAGEIFEQTISQSDGNYGNDFIRIAMAYTYLIKSFSNSEPSCNLNNLILNTINTYYSKYSTPSNTIHKSIARLHIFYILRLGDKTLNFDTHRLIDTLLASTLNDPYYTVVYLEECHRYNKLKQSDYLLKNYFMNTKLNNLALIKLSISRLSTSLSAINNESSNFIYILKNKICSLRSCNK